MGRDFAPSVAQCSTRPPEVDACAEQLSSLGIELLEPVADLQDSGDQVLFFADPENNVIEIYADV